MSERERKSPKFYVAEGVMLRMRESIAYVLDNPTPQDITPSHLARRERALGNRTKQVLETLEVCGLITRAECVEIKQKLWDLLDGDEEKRRERKEKVDG
jgi:hypothetical protein